MDLSTIAWANSHDAITKFCVSIGENGIVNDPADLEIGIEHSGDELPPYRC